MGSEASYNLSLYHGAQGRIKELEDRIVALEQINRLQAEALAEERALTRRYQNVKPGWMGSTGLADAGDPPDDTKSLQYSGSTEESSQSSGGVES